MARHETLVAPHVVSRLGVPAPDVEAEPAIRGHSRLRKVARQLPEYGLMLIVVAVADLPLLWMLINAMKPAAEIVRYPPTILPHTWTTANFVNLFTVSDFGVFLRNSLILSIATTVLTVVCGTLGAYALTRFEFRFLRGIGELALCAYLVPPILVLVPLAQILHSIHLTNSLLGLLLLYTGLFIPFALWILQSYFRDLTVDLEEAAMIDGCTRFGAFRRVVVPQAVPGLISTAIFTFNAAWSEYLFASTLISDSSKLTLSPGLESLVQDSGIYGYGILMAGSLVVVLPVIVLFVLGQRFLTSGWGQGALK